MSDPGPGCDVPECDVPGCDRVREAAPGTRSGRVPGPRARAGAGAGWLSNHAPMAVEALVRHGRAPAVHRWLELGGEATAPRVTEPAHGLGYWAARHQPLPAPTPPAPEPSAAAALDAVPPVSDRSGGIRDRLARLTGFPVWPPRPAGAPDEVAARLEELVRAATHRYAAYGYGEPIMLVHAATAPNAVLRTLPALPRTLWGPSLEAAWAASAAVTAAYAPAEPAPARGPDPSAPEFSSLPSSSSSLSSAEEVFARAAAHGNDHAIKFADTALDVGDATALRAALGAVELIPPAL
ncbi:hypothetical protein ACF1FX_11265 [Streptomyces sp. NPDC014646]|uniref:hypothetical protein n=1 Tax=Streptomyces sp. NPDC014646 TaxID=3364877 RepID=UPI0036FC9919